MEQKRPADIFQEFLDYLWNGLGLEEKGWKRLKKGDFKKKMKNGLTYQVWFDRSRYNYIDYEIGHGNVEVGFSCIINLPHPTSAKHPRMPLSDRAAQFAPFAALSGHSAALAETARLTDQRMELDEDARAALDLKQQLLLERIKERPEITATWFQPDEKKDGGRYIVSTGRLKRIHEADQVLILADGLRIPIGDIVELESECIRGLL